MYKTDLRGSLGQTLILLLLVSILGAGCQTNTGAQSSAGGKEGGVEAIALTPGLIEPGKGIKEVKLGQTRAEVQQSLGVPTGEDKNEFVKGQVYLLYHPRGIELTLQDDVVANITLHSKSKEWGAYTGGTAEGLGVGSTAKEVTGALGAADDEAPRALRYQARGIIFRFDSNREGDGSNARVESVSVQAPEL